MIHNNWIGVNGVGIGNNDPIVIVNIAPIFVDNWNFKNLLMLSKIVLPSFIEETIVAKLSSCMIISADSFVTSVPLPIATPIEAFLSAGASFTPSPVIDTISPWFWRTSMILLFCSGYTLA